MAVSWPSWPHSTHKNTPSNLSEYIVNSCEFTRCKLCESAWRKLSSPQSLAQGRWPGAATAPRTLHVSEFFSRKTVNISAMINNTSNKFNQYQSIQHSLRLYLHAAYSYTPHSSQLFRVPSTSHVPVPCSNGSSGAIGFWASALTCTNPRMNQAPSFTDSRTLHSPKDIMTPG